MILRKDTEQQELNIINQTMSYLLDIELPSLGLVQIGPQAMYTAIKSIILAEEYANEAHCTACLREYWLVSLFVTKVPSTWCGKTETTYNIKI